MLKLAKNKIARPFHGKLYKTAQSATDYARWVNQQKRRCNCASLLQGDSVARGPKLFSIKIMLLK
jgi:hypothetical protein